MERFRLDTTNHSTHSVIPTEAILSVQDYLTQFSLSEKFIERIKIAFGDRFDLAKLEELRQQWAAGNFEALPEIEIRPAAEINGAIGAFSADTDTIYLSREYITQNAFYAQAIANVVLEEIGHFVDSQINISDASGDEGAIFSALVQGVGLNKQKLQSLKSEDDTADLTLNGEPIQIEQATEIKRPILIVPGIGGTFGKDFNSEWYVNRGVKPEQLVIDPIARVYNDLIQTLKNVGYEEGRNLFVANYDWRLPVGPQDDAIDGKIAGLTAEKITDNTFENSVDYLGYWLRQAAESWEKQFGTSPESVDIITHSTGGLITRAYIQSGAYGGSFPSSSGSLTLPEVNNFFMIGVPHRGASQAWNPLHDNWIRKSDNGVINTGADRIVLSKILRKSYRRVLNGETISGSPTPISLETIKNPLTNKPDPVKFVNQYAPTLRDLLATYKFIETVDEFPLGIFDVNNDPSQRNSFLLDLNNGFDLSAEPSNPNSFATKTKSHPIAIFGTSEPTETTVTKITGGQLGGNDYSDVILPFTELFANDPEPKEVWYRSNAIAENGDGTVPLQSSRDPFVKDPNVELKPFTKGINTEDTLEHIDLVSNIDIQELILNTLGFSVPKEAISTSLQLSSFRSLLIAILPSGINIFDLPVLDPFASSRPNSGPLFQLNALQTPSSSASSDSEIFQLNASQALSSSANSDNIESFLSQLPDLITSKFGEDGNKLPILGDQLKNLDFLNQIGLEDISDIKLDDTTNPDEVKVTLKLSKQLDKFDIPIEGDFGLPGLRLEVDGNTQLDVGLNFTLSFGVNKNTGFFIDT